MSMFQRWRDMTQYFLLSTQVQLSVWNMLSCWNELLHRVFKILQTGELQAIFHCSKSYSCDHWNEFLHTRCTEECMTFVIIIKNNWYVNDLLYMFPDFLQMARAITGCTHFRGCRALVRNKSNHSQVEATWWCSPRDDMNCQRRTPLQCVGRLHSRPPYGWCILDLSVMSLPQNGCWKHFLPFGVRW